MKRIFKYLIPIIIYRLLLDFIYFNQIEPVFGYALFINRATTASSLTSWIIILVLFPFVIKILEAGRNNLISYSVIFLFFIRVIPFSSFLQFQPQVPEFYVLHIVYWMILLILLNKFNDEKTVWGFNNPRAIDIVAIISILTVLIISGVYAHFRIHLSLADVYDLREEAREFNMPLLWKYLNAATANVIPLVMVYYVTQNKKAWIYLLAFVGLLNFSIAGSKSTLFKIVLALLLFAFRKKDLYKIIIPSFLMICGLSILEYLAMNTNVISTLLIRRMFYIPSLLDSFYYDYISQHTPLYYATSKYPILNFTIGTEYFRADAMRANNGLFSDAYSNLGSFGCIVCPIIVAYFFKICNNISNGQNKGIIMFFSFLVVLTIGGSFFTTSLLTHGLLLLCITIYLMPKQTEYEI